jgi:OOP family OmpA-OmpF porin
MKIIKVTNVMGLALMAAFGSQTAMAQDAGWYGGLSAGQSRAKIDDDRISRDLLGSGFTVNGITNDERDTGFKVFGGYQLNRNFALEGGYFDLGRFGFNANVTPTGSLAGTIRLRGLNLDAVGLLPITERLSAFGRVGVNYAEARDHFTGTGAVSVFNPNPSKRDTNYKFGAGLQYAITDALNVRLEAERYRVNDAVGNRGDVDLMSIGLVYRFGDKSPTPVARPIAPEPVAYVPPPVAAVTPPPPPPPAPRKVSFSADSLFDFGKSVVTPSGNAALNRFATDLSGTDYEVVRVTGHTDRIGGHAANQKLSERRAEAVKVVLVNAAIPAAKIEAKGVDGADPVTKPEQCPGAKVTKKLIACLQPDRRVDVEVSGTR